MMDDARLSELVDRLDAIVQEFSLKNAAFCANDDESQFIGSFVGQEKMTAACLMNSATNIGRLWQYARERTREWLNSFEQDRWSERKPKK